MAGYREHITVSGVLGVCIGTVAVYGFGFSYAQGALAAVLAWVSGMLPDLDSSSGRPVREVFSLLAAAAPLLLLQRLLEWTHSSDEVLLGIIFIYAAVRYGGAYLVCHMSVHRGMFHSIPAALIAALTVFLCYKADNMAAKVLMGAAAGLGYASHLVLDEIYSVEWTGVRLKLNQFAGSALKFFSSSVYANLFTYCLLSILIYFTLIQLEVIHPAVTFQPLPQKPF